MFSKIGEINELKYLRSYRNDIEFSVFDKEERDKQYIDLLNNKLMDENFDYSSYKSGIIYHHLRARIFMQFSTKESEIEAYQLNLKFLKHMESHPDLLKLNLVTYSTAINNLIYIQSHLGLFDDSLKAINKLSAIKTEDQFLKFRIQEKIIVNKLSYYLFVDKYAEGVKYIKEIEDEFIENESQYNSLFFYLCNS